MTAPAVRTHPRFVLEGETTPVGTLVHELWASRRLIAILARKDFFVRYRRASLGLFWAVGLPLLQATILAFVFSRVAPGLVPGTNYTAFIFSGVVAWSFFTATMPTASTAIVDGASLSSKIYFPRAVLPLVSVAAGVYGLVISVAILLALLAVVGVGIAFTIVLLVPATVLLVVFTAAVGTAAAALHVYLRDVRYLVQAALMAWFYVTPVLYPLERAPGVLRDIVRLNPMTGIVELFHAATVGAGPGWEAAVGISVAWTAILAIAALALHRRYNRVFADLL